MTSDLRVPVSGWAAFAGRAGGLEAAEPFAGAAVAPTGPGCKNAATASTAVPSAAGAARRRRDTGEPRRWRGVALSGSLLDSGSRTGDRSDESNPHTMRPQRAFCTTARSAPTSGTASSPSAPADHAGERFARAPLRPTTTRADHAKASQRVDMPGPLPHRGARMDAQRVVARRMVI